MKNNTMKHLLAAALCLMLNFSMYAHSDDPIRRLPALKSEVKSNNPINTPDIQFITNKEITSSQFLFPELEGSIAEYAMSAMLPPEGDDLTPFMIEIGDGQVSAKVKKAQEIVQKAIDIGNKIDLLTGGDLVKMPIYKTQTIGQTEVTIVFNSATIHPQYAEIQVFARIELPYNDFNGVPVVLYFGANNIFFSQEKGIIRGNLELLADFSFKIGEMDPKAGIWLEKAVKGNLISNGGTENFLLDDEYEYSGTYINFDCEGFKEMGIGGRVYFSRDWVKPTDEFGEPLQVPNDTKSETPRTWGAFQFTAQDWNDILVSVDILDPFVLTKWEDMSFHLRNAHLDLSSYRNPPNIPVSYGINSIIWEGVYIDTIGITLPKPFKRVKESYNEVEEPPADENFPLPERERIRISATHLLIDEDGVSGQFAIDGQVPLIGGAIMAGEWGWSLDHIGITLIQSDITLFEFGGQLGVPLLSKDGPLSYTGKFDFDLDIYSFTAGGLGEKATIPVWNAAQIVMEQEAELEVTLVENEFNAALTFPDLAFVLGTEKDYANSLKGSKVKLPGIKFIDLRVATSQPYISYGSIDIQTGNSKLMEFPFNLSAYKMVTPPDNPEQLNFEFTLDLNLMGQNETGVEAKGDLKLIGDYKRDINGARHWVYRTLEFVGAEVTVNLSQVWAHGTICLFEEDEQYGDGFYANVDARIIGDNLHLPENGMFTLDLMAVFGSTSGYRYFMVDGFVGGDAISVPLFGPFYLDGFGGGVFHNMKPDSYDANGTEAPGQACANVNSTSGIKYLPNSETKLGFNFACGISTTSNLMTGLLTCIVRFDQNMSLQNITFWGVASIMVGSKLSERLIPGFTELKQKIADNTVPLEELKKNNKTAATATPVNPNPVPENAIKAALGISMDFVNGFSLHGFADVSIKVYDKPGPPIANEPPAKLILTGRGTLDLLLAGNDWHLYVGGFYPNSYGAEVRVPDFFNSGGFITLAPVNITIDYQDFKISANAYFLTGNGTIPGPPPPAPEVVDFFGEEASETNRHLLDCSPNSRALGTGIAFGASAFIDFSKVKKGLFGSCFLGVKLNIKGGAGFDLALLKFDKETICSLSKDSPQGLNGFRAAGRIFVFIDIEGNHVTCLPIPPLGVGVKIRFDVPNPSYFEIVAILKVGKEFKFKLGLGEECGAPCVSSVLLD